MAPRKPVIDECLLATMYEAGESVYFMSRELGASRAYVYKVMRRLGLRARGIAETYPLTSAKLRRKHMTKDQEGSDV